ncbi:MAG: phytoene desaturase family protein [Persicimonas sp.]
MQTKRVHIIGAGMGGLSAAIALASRGHEVCVFEAAERVGGKVGIATVDAVEFDTGPSLLTLPGLIDELFQLAGTSLADEIELVRHERAFEYMWPDGSALDVYFSPEATVESVRSALGARAADEFDDFLHYARRIWEAAAPNFVLGEAPSVGSIMRLGLGALGEVMAIDPMRTMAEAVDKRVRTPQLRDVLLRYATYNGSNPFEAPATLNCIAWVELGLGGYGVKGGLVELARAMERVARGLDVEFRLGEPVSRVEVAAGRVVAVHTDAGRRPGRYGCDAVVVNAEVAHLVEELLPADTDSGLAPPETPSMSGWTGLVRARRRTEQSRAPHTVLFPERYDEEFGDIFERGRPPAEPTVYVCAQEKAHRRAGWADHEPLFVMANAPAEPADSQRPNEACSNDAYETLRDTVLERLRGAGLIDTDDAVVWQRTPSELASQFPGSRGSIYGAASNSKFAAFRRPSNRVAKVGGLYLACGGVHPGGGVPLCVQSGKTAARVLDEDFG